MPPDACFSFIISSSDLKQNLPTDKVAASFHLTAARFVNLIESFIHFIITIFFAVIPICCWFTVGRERAGENSGSFSLSTQPQTASFTQSLLTRRHPLMLKAHIFDRRGPICPPSALPAKTKTQPSPAHKPDSSAAPPSNKPAATADATVRGL